MGYITDNKLLYHMEKVLYTQKPITAEIFLTDFCNHRCSYCRYHHGNKYIKFEDFKVYVNRCLELGVEGFILTGGGEPTLNPDFDKIIEWLEKHNISYGINTNFNELKFMKPKFLKVSIDAYSPEQYEEIRKVEKDNYYRVRENLKKYREWQKEQGARTTVGIQSIVLEKNHATYFYFTYNKLDIDYIVFRPVESVENFYNDELLKSIMDELRKLQNKDSRVLINFKWDMVNKRFKECISSWSVLTIDCNGNVIYCCHKQNEVIGNILDPVILEKKKAFITDMRNCEMPCRLSGSNSFLEGLKCKGNHHEFV